MTNKMSKYLIDYVYTANDELFQVLSSNLFSKWQTLFCWESSKIKSLYSVEISRCVPQKDILI